MIRNGAGNNWEYNLLFYLIAYKTVIYYLERVEFFLFYMSLYIAYYYNTVSNL